MDTLVGIGVISSFLYSLYGMFMILKGNHQYVENLYFESAAIVIFFIKLGRYIDGVSKDRTKDAIKRLVQITPNEATIKIDGKEKKVTIDEIKKGDIVVSYAGDRIAVDGEIVEGKSHLDEAFITGESKPVTKSVGNKVIAGSINYDGYLEYKAERIGKESTISEIVRIVMEATSSKASIAKIADKISGYFVPIIIVLAIITFGVYLALDLGISNAVSSFVTVLVIACPCSLGLATPLAIVVSEGVCAENGILVKKSEILENAMKIDRVVFDKTGTLTYGNLKVSKIYNFSKLSDSELMQIAGSIETKSTHPISKAFTEYLKENKLETLEVSEFENKSGFGIKAKITNNEYHLGNSKMVSNLEIDNEHLQEEEILAEDGNSIVYVIENKEILGLIGINDIIRDTSKELISNLKECKIEPIMLTGDNIKTAEKIAKEIGITNIIANVLPTEKADKIKNLQKENRKIMMVGDGINDSPALAISDIGVSITSGTDIAMDSSDVILMQNDLSKILSLIKISKKTIRNIKQNLFWAFFYNVLMIPIAMGVLKPIGISINPMIAGLAMTLSSLTVILNASRLKYIKF
jgi:Cu+-exporting ATPase